MARNTFTLHPSAMQALFLTKVFDNGSTGRATRATSHPYALWRQQQRQLQILLLFILYCGFMLLNVANGATMPLGSSLASDGRTTLLLNETLVSQNGQFVLGFYHDDTAPLDTGYNLAIWYAEVPESMPLWMPATTIVLSNKSSLSLSTDGVLQVKDTLSGSLPVWNTPTAAMNVTMAVILNTGNLVLYNKKNQTLWQSFDYPTNTLLPNQMYSSNSRIMLYSWKSENNYTSNPGQYAMNWNTPNYLELVYLSPNWQPTVMYWNNWIPSLSYVGNISNTSVVLTPTGEFQAVLAPNIYTVIGESNTTSLDYLRRITLDIDGQLRMYSWKIGTSKNWNIDWSAVSSTCDILGWCGPFAVCVAGVCQCPQGFIWINETNQMEGCVRTEPPYFCNKTGVVDNLVPEPADYPWGIDMNYFANVSLDDCKQSCLDACACQCATVSYPDPSGNVRCWLKSGTLINGVYLNDRTSYLRMAPTFIGNGKREIPYSTARLIVYIISPLTVIFGLILCIIGWPSILKWSKAYQLHKLEKKWKAAHGTIVRFTYDEIKLITQNFSEKIGKGGYGTVYKGEIRHNDANAIVAVKQLDKLDQGVKTFITEVDVIGSIHHIHLIHLLGYCADAQHKVLVYEYMEKRSLDLSLFQVDKSTPVLEWRPRFNIAIQTARGLAYLHDGIRDQRIIHCDVKPENILINSAYSAKVADFGLSRILSREQSLTMTSHIRGTCGYLAPEWTSNHTPISPKTDVYSFGMVLFEIISGRRNSKPPSTSSNEYDTNNWYFPLWAYFILNESNFDVSEVLDPSLTGISDCKEVERVVKVAFWCIHDNHQLRPSMSKVVQMLEGHVPIGLPIPKPNFNDMSLEPNVFPILAKEVPI